MQVVNDHVSVQRCNVDNLINDDTSNDDMLLHLRLARFAMYGAKELQHAYNICHNHQVVNTTIIIFVTVNAKRKIH